MRDAVSEGEGLRGGGFERGGGGGRRELVGGGGGGGGRGEGVGGERGGLVEEGGIEGRVDRTRESVEPAHARALVEITSSLVGDQDLDPGAAGSVRGREGEGEEGEEAG